MEKPSNSSSNSHSIFFTDELEKYVSCNFIKIESIRHRIHKKGLRLSRKSVKLLKVFFNKQIENYLEKIHSILVKNNRVTIKPIHFQQLFREENIRIRILGKNQKKMEAFL